jgi:TIR domain-containing protein
MADIFISWSQDDGDVVGPVVARLKGYCWKLYFSGDNVEAGRIDENVADAIAHAKVMVLFVSPRPKISAF